MQTNYGFINLCKKLFFVKNNVVIIKERLWPLRILELPEGAPDLTLTILSHSLYDHQPDIRWLIEQISQCTFDGSREPSHL